MRKYLCVLLALCLSVGFGSVWALAEGNEPAPLPGEESEPSESETTPPDAGETTPTPSETTPTPSESTPAEPSVDPSDDASETPSASPSEAPSESPSTDPSTEPSTDPSASPSTDPSGTPSTGTTQEPHTPTPTPTLPPLDAEAEGYVMGPMGKVNGTLEELLSTAGAKDVYVTARKPVTIKSFPLKLLRGVKFLPDPDTFNAPGVKYTVKLYDGAGDEILPGDIEAAQDGDVIDLTVAVEQQPNGGPTPTNPGDIALSVEVRNFAGDGVWQSDIPEFQLSGIPGDSENYGYVAIIYDERIIPLAGDSYMPTEEGKYSLRFAIMNPQGDIVGGVSDKYELWLDYTPPVLNIEVSATQDFSMTLSGYDELSGVVALSLDGGETWTQAELDKGLSVVHTEGKPKVFPEGMIRIRDLAGNESWNMEEVVLDKVPSVGGFGGGGGGGDDTPVQQHASGEGDDAPYAAYELELPEGAVAELTLGGEPIELGMEIEDETHPDGEAGLFTAEFATWAEQAARNENIAGDEEAGEPAKDTLLICADTGASGDAYTCRWRINGAVLRKLYNTGILYLGLSAGDAMLSLPTQGFVAGTKYAELKMNGVSTANFEYEIAMTIDPTAEHATDAAEWNFSPQCGVELSVEVGGERYELIDRLTSPEMYPTDVYCAPMDLIDYPYGRYPAAGEDGEVVSTQYSVVS